MTNSSSSPSDVGKERVSALVRPHSIEAETAKTWREAARTVIEEFRTPTTIPSPEDRT